MLHGPSLDSLEVVVGSPSGMAYGLVGALRVVLMLNSTWLVNSAAQLFGDHPYDQITFCLAENPVVAILSIGEGWHN